jgi:hypothetical protein
MIVEVIMKKTIIFILVFLATVLQIYAQNDLVAYYVNKCLNLLGKTVPEGFQRMNRTDFRNDEDIFLTVENGLITVSGFGSAFERSNEAAEFNALLYDYFEKNNWNYYNSTFDGSDIYLKNGIYAYIANPRKRDDGLIATIIGFSKNINNF